MCNTFNKGGTRSKSFNFAGTQRRILVNRGNKLNGRAAGPGPADRARLRSARLQEIKKGLEPPPPKPVGPQLSPPRVPRRYSRGPLIIFTKGLIRALLKMQVGCSTYSPKDMFMVWSIVS